MKPTLCPAARRIEVRQAPVEPLPLVPAISAPLSFRSGAPRRSRMARVRSVPSFIAKRPCLERKSRASGYVKRSARSGLDGVGLDLSSRPISMHRVMIASYRHTAYPSAWLAGACGLLYSVSFVLIARASPGLGAGLSGLFLLTGGVFGASALLGLYIRLGAAGGGYALWALVFGLAGALAATLHGGYDLANAIHPPDQASSLPSAIDPRGLGTFGIAGIAMLAFAYLMGRDASFPRNLSYLGYLSGDRIHAGPEVPDLATADPVGADVDHRRAGLHHLLADQAGVPGRGDEDVGAPRVTPEVLRPGVAEGHGGIALQQEQRRRLSNQVASSNNNRVRAVDPDARPLEQ